LGGDGRWKINWEFVDCGTARAAGSNLPHHRSMLRGLQSFQATYLQPGEMVTAEGIVPIAEVFAL